MVAGLKQLVGPGGWWGLMSLLASGVAVGTLPDLLAQELFGGRWIGLGAAAVVGLVGYFLAEYKRRPKPGVGVVLHLYDLPDRDDRRVEVYRQHALGLHASCFVVDVPRLLHNVTVSDPAHFAFQAAQARLQEAERDGGLEAADDVSVYLSAQHQEAFWLGGLSRTQVHRRVTLMGAQFSRDNPTVFPAVRLDDRLKEQPDATDRELLWEMLGRDPEEQPEWRPFSGAPAHAPPALIFAVANPQRTVDQAQRAAEAGEGAAYAFPGDRSPGENRAAGALVIRTGGSSGTGQVPNSRDHYEALVRYVSVQWRQCLARHPHAGFGWLFTDAPVPLIAALGWLFRLDTRPVPHVKSDRTVRPR